MIVPIRILNNKNLPKDVWHPSVVFVPSGWNGHRWWMSETPYSPRHIPPYTDRWELPCIHYSDDGLKWHPIKQNPIDDLTQEDISQHNYLSDPHLVMKDGVMYCYYRYTILENRQLFGNKTILYCKHSTDGENWSERELVADLRKEEDVAIWGEQVISQSILWNEKKEIWECWFVDGSGDKLNRGVRYVWSKDGIHWEKYQQCIVPIKNDLPWHIDVQKYGGEYHMLCYTDNNVLALYTSKDRIDFAYQNVALTPQPNTFYWERIYRSCSVFDGKKYRIYFSGFDGELGRIGMLTTEDWENYKLYSMWWNLDYYCDKIKSRIQHRKQAIRRKVKKLLGRK